MLATLLESVCYESHLQHADRRAAQAVRVGGGCGRALGGKQADQGVQPGGRGNGEKGVGAARMLVHCCLHQHKAIEPQVSGPQLRATARALSDHQPQCPASLVCHGYQQARGCRGQHIAGVARQDRLKDGLSHICNRGRPSEWCLRWLQGKTIEGGPLSKRPAKGDHGASCLPCCVFRTCRQALLQRVVPPHGARQRRHLGHLNGQTEQ